MILDSSLKSIRVVLLEAKTTTDCDVTASYADQTGAGFLPGANDTVTNGTTPVTLVSAPGSGGQRSVQEITFHNNDTVTHTVILQLDDNATIRIFREATVASGSDFTYSPGSAVAAGNAIPTPSVATALDMIRINSAGTAYEVQTPSQVLGNIAGGVSGAINATTIGATTASTGAFTTLSASGAVSGAGITALFTAPTTIGSGTPNTGAFTTLSATSTISGAGFTAWAASPPTIGSTAPNTGAFTTLSASSTVSGTGFSTYLASPPSIGNALAASGAFTTLSASSTVSGTGFSTYLASPPAIGGSAPAAGSFTTISATGLITPSATVGIAGTTTNNSAQAGSIGEEIETVISSGSPVTLTTTIVNTVASIPLTAGDWDVSGEVWVNVGTGGATLMQAAISATTGVPTNATSGSRNLLQASLTASTIQIIPLRPARVSLSGSASYFLLASMNFPSGSCSAYGNIWARRAR
jgi:hypothetical protein